jgi:hypothetical protein
MVPAKNAAAFEASYLDAQRISKAKNPHTIFSVTFNLTSFSINC